MADESDAGKSTGNEAIEETKVITLDNLGVVAAEIKKRMLKTEASELIARTIENAIVSATEEEIRALFAEDEGETESGSGGEEGGG